MTVQFSPRHLSHVPPLAVLASPGPAHDRGGSSLAVMAFLMRQVARGWCATTRQLLESGLLATARTAAEMGAPNGW